MALTKADCNVLQSMLLGPRGLRRQSCAGKLKFTRSASTFAMQPAVSPRPSCQGILRVTAPLTAHIQMHFSRIWIQCAAALKSLSFDRSSRRSITTQALAVIGPAQATAKTHLNLLFNQTMKRSLHAPQTLGRPWSCQVPAAWGKLLSCDGWARDRPSKP